MSDLLSEGQIAALVEAAREGTVPSAAVETAVRRPRRVRDVDFSRPTKFSQDQQRRIGRGYEAFCRSVSTQLSAQLRTPVELELLNVDQQTWSAALNEIPKPSLYAVVATDAGLNLLVGIELGVVMRMSERLLGGSYSSVPVDRELTEIELALARRLMNTMLGQLSRAWDELMGSGLTLLVLETQVANIQLVPSSEPTLAITSEVRIDQQSSTLTLLVPHRSIEADLLKMSVGHYGDTADVHGDEHTGELVSAALRGVSVEVRAEIGSNYLTIDELLALRPGDLVRLGPSADTGTLFADAVPIHRTKPGRSGNHRAIEILDRIETK